MRMRQGWEREAGNWARFARTPGHDRAHEDINLPVLRELLPAAGRQTLDFGCGEGRVGRLLASLGHRVTGIDASPSMAALARGHADPLPACPFVIAGSYADAAPVADAVDRDGYRLTFHSEHRPLEAYSRALEAAGLLTEAIREARLSEEAAERDPEHRRWARIPLFLHLRAVRPQTGPA